MSKYVSIAPVSWFRNRALHLRVFLCDGAYVTERRTDDDATWSDGRFKKTAGTSVGATSWLDADGHPQMRVYVGTSAGQVVEYLYDNDAGKWTTTGTTFAGRSGSPTAYITASGALTLRVLVEQADGSVLEMRQDDGGPWSEGAIVCSA